MIDFCILIAVIAVVAVLLSGAGCADSSAPPRDGELRIFWSRDSNFPMPMVVRAHVPYDGAPVEATGYTPVVP